MKKVFVIAGETSGDLHGAYLVKALKQMDPSLELYGAGGQRMRNEIDSGFVEMGHLAATGLTEVFRHLPHYLRLFKVIAHRIKETAPDLVVFIDNPGFNLRLAKKLAPKGVPMVYYICPQIWAWGQDRIHLIKRCFRKALVVFEFEQEIYKTNKMPVTWVGHPLKEVLRKEDGINLNWPANEIRIVLMPGSRQHEVKTLLPILLKAGEKILRRFPTARFFLIKAPHLTSNFYAEILPRSCLEVRIVEEHKYAVMRSADLALACSGTATLECSLLGLPMVVVNRASFLTYLAVRAAIKVRHLAIPNLILGETVVPELLQYNCHPANVAIAAFELLENPVRKEAAKVKLAEVNQRLGEENASSRAAAEILKEL